MDGKKISSGLSPVNVNVEFSRQAQSASRQAKAQEFWKYLDGQSDLKPYQVPKFVVEKDKTDESSAPDNSSTSSDASPSASSSSAGARPKERPAKKEKKQQQQQQQRANAETCKLEKYFREDLRLADTVEATYDELNAEIEVYQERLRLQVSRGNSENDCRRKQSESK